MARAIAALLLALLAVARGAGGIVLMLQGPEAVDSDLVGLGTARLLGLGLLAVSAAALLASYGLTRQARWASTLAIAVPVVFVLDGALNGHLLFGHVGDRGTITNVVAAVIIIGVVFLARRRSGAVGPV